MQEFSPDLWAEGQSHWNAFKRRIIFHRSEFDNTRGFKWLRERLNEIDSKAKVCGNRLFYLATPPSQYPTIIKQLDLSGLTQCDPVEDAPEAFVRIIVEKPFGSNLESARELNQSLKAVFRERQIYRIDHYLGKETVQNIFVFRFANAIFEPIWNQRHVDNVQITVSETVGVETRAGYFDTAGELRDMVQSHALQLLTLVAMEPPVSMEANAIRDEKVKVMRAIPLFSPEDVANRTVRGQYTAGVINGQPQIGYKEEKGVAPNSTTETYVALKLFIENWRWADVPFYIRTGKVLPKRSTEVTIQFKRVPHQLYKPSETTGLVPNRLTIRIQPDEGMSLKFAAKVPGAARNLCDVDMNFSYASAFGIESPDAYERLIADCMTGDSTLFIRRDEVETSWRIIDGITSVWKNMPASTVYPYRAGTWGPPEADELIERDGRQWDNP